jgi:hypothetical protein
VQIDLRIDLESAMRRLTPRQVKLCHLLGEEGCSIREAGRRELLTISPHAFEDLKRRKILTYYRSPDDDMETLRRPRYQHGCLLTVQKFGELYEAFCLNHPEEDAILVAEDELNRYASSVTGLFGEFRSANHMNGMLSTIDSRSYHSFPQSKPTTTRYLSTGALTGCTFPDRSR